MKPFSPILFPMENKFCPKCGKPNTQGHRFCRICGVEIRESVEGNNQQQNSASSILSDFKKKDFVITLLVGVGILFVLLSLLQENWAEEDALSASENELITKLETTVRKIGEHIESISVTGSDLPTGARASFYDRIYANDDINMPYIVNLAGEAVSLYEDYIQEFGSDRYKFDEAASLVRTAFFFVKQEEVDRAAGEGNASAISNIVKRVDTFANGQPFHSHLEKKRLLDELAEYQSVLKQAQSFAAGVSELERIEAQMNSLSARADYEYEANRQYNQLVNTYNTKLAQVDRYSDFVNSREAHQKKLALVDVELLIPSVHEIGISNASGAIK